MDINSFRVDKGGNPEIIRESQRQRGADPELVDRVIDLDQQWIKADFDARQLVRDHRVLSKQFGKLKKAKEDTTELAGKISAIKVQTDETKAKQEDLLKQRDRLLSYIGNLVHTKVPISLHEEDNVIERTSGTPHTKADAPLNHVALIKALDIADTARGVKVAGNRGYFLKGLGQRMNMALQCYGVDFLSRKGYLSIQPPFFMTAEAMKGCAQLEQYEEELYKVTGEGGDRFLIATSEQPMCAYHMSEVIPATSLPMRYAGVSSCFRKEVGRHGQDTLGIFRVHQFEKIEQFVVCHPDQSWDEMESMISVAEEFYKSLGIPFRVVNIVSGELNNAAAMKYDLEGHFPASEAYRELVSCSNCTDYQSRRLDVRMEEGKKGEEPKPKGKKKAKKGPRPFVHMLNATLTATERTMCCILENCQTPEGVVIPEPLRPYMGGAELIPFVAKK